MMLYKEECFVATIAFVLSFPSPPAHTQDPDMFWDFITLRPESTHQVSFLFSDRGIPNGYRHMNGYGSHTFKLVNKDGEAVYCKFHYKVCMIVVHKWLSLTLCTRSTTIMAHVMYSRSTKRHYNGAVALSILVSCSHGSH